MARILIIEDDSNINELLAMSLRQEGYECVSAYSGTEGILHLEQQLFDLVLLDLMLPGLSGERVLESVKEKNETPVIVISAKDELDTKVNLLTLGAEDYITKPFEIKEVKARVNVQLRKYNRIEPLKQIEHKQLVLLKESQEVMLHREKLSLTRQEYRILELLLTNKEKVFSKQEIYDYAWDDYYIGEDKTINVHVSNMRQKMRKITEEEYIETVWGIGYKIAK